MLERGSPRWTQGRWVVTRYADVVAALRDRRLSADGAPEAADAPNPARRAALALAGPARLSAMEPVFRRLAEERIAALPSAGELDLMAAFARPWCADLAMSVTGAAEAERALLLSGARALFEWAGDPDDPKRKAPADRAVGALAQSLGNGLDVQTFVALAVSVPCFLANAWNEIFRRPGLVELLRASPDALPTVIDELLRLVGPSRAQLRQASVDVELGGVLIPAGSRLALHVAVANRDPDVFANPDEVSLEPRSSPHLTFGSGPHACAGMAIVQAAALWATTPLLPRLSSLRWIDDPGAQGGWAVGGDARVRVVVADTPPG